MIECVCLRHALDAPTQQRGGDPKAFADESVAFWKECLAGLTSSQHAEVEALVEAQANVVMDRGSDGKWRPGTLFFAALAISPSLVTVCARMMHKHKQLPTGWFFFLRGGGTLDALLHSPRVACGARAVLSSLPFTFVL